VKESCEGVGTEESISLFLVLMPDGQSGSLISICKGIQSGFLGGPSACDSVQQHHLHTEFHNVTVSMNTFPSLRMCLEPPEIKNRLYFHRGDIWAVCHHW